MCYLFIREMELNGNNSSKCDDDEIYPDDPMFSCIITTKCS